LHQLPRRASGRPTDRPVLLFFYLRTPAKHVCGAAVALPQDRLFCIAPRETQSALAAIQLPPLPPPADSMTATAIQERERAMTRAVTCWGRRHVRIESPLAAHLPSPTTPISPLVTARAVQLVGYDCDTRHKIHIVARFVFAKVSEGWGNNAVFPRVIRTHKTQRPFSIL
jgi:hypothetical protein